MQLHQVFLLQREKHQARLIVFRGAIKN